MQTMKTSGNPGHAAPGEAFVAGGTGEIGAEVVRQLARDGWQVTFSFKTQGTTARELAAESNARAVSIDDLFQRAELLPESLGAFVNCIGVNPIDEEIATTPVEVFRDVIETNLVQAFALSQRLLPSLIAGRGTIVHLSSIWGVRAVEGAAAYVSSKHGMRGLTATLAREYGPRGVTCNEICPGAVQSRMLRECTARYAGQEPSQIQAAIREIEERTPIRRLVTVAEIVAAVSFLCSKKCRGMNGASLVIDGGLTT